jgi:predicted nuclease of predicted toxin-antitoxin system
MKSMKFLANMNISPKTIESLRRSGWDILRVSEVLKSTSPDMLILEYSRQEGRILITQDLDFSNLLALNNLESPSLVTLRLSGANPQLITERLRQVLPELENVLKEGNAIIIEDASVRIRKLPLRHPIQ